jgi:hypothetical protein
LEARTSPVQARSAASVEATLGVQQKLMRHADIAPTSRHGNSFMDMKREANSNVARMVLPQMDSVVFRSGGEGAESLAKSS